MTASDLYQDKSNEELILEYQQTKDNQIKQEIVLRYVYLVKMIAMQMRGIYLNFIDIDDIIQEGIITLMSAVDKFDSSKNVKFESYLSLRLRGTIIDLARKNDWQPRSYRKTAKLVEQAEFQLYEKLGRHPTDQEMADHLNVGLEKYLKMLNQTNLQNILSLDEMIDEYQNGADILLKDNDLTNLPEHTLESNELKKKMEEAIMTMRENEQLVISLYYRKNLNMQEIAEVLGVKAPRVSQIHANAIRKLKITMEKYIKN